MPVPLSVILFGKLLGVILFAFIQTSIIVIFTKIVYGVDWGSNYAGIAAVCALVSIATVCFSVILSSFVRNRRAIETIFSVLITSMTFLSGGMIVELSPVVKEIGKFTLNHWANEAVRTMMAGGTLRDSLQEIGILSAIAAVLLVLSILRFRKAVELA